MSASNFNELIQHLGHHVEVVTYGKKIAGLTEVYNVAIECVDCCEVLLDFDSEEEDEED